MRLLRGDLSEEHGRLYQLILISSSISHRLEERSDGWELWVDGARFDEAAAAIEEYERENPSVPRAVRGTQDEGKRSYTGLWVAGLLLVVHVAIATSDDAEGIVRAFGASAWRIRHGELYRTVTALLIHGGLRHLAGNMAGMALFGTVVSSATGWGTGWLMILASGMIGNWINALLRGGHHISIGASTAVFGAVGILTVRQFLKKRAGRDGRAMKAWVPLAGGLALLSMLGAGAGVDLGAHLFGFMAGLILGSAFCGVAEKTKASRVVQTVCAALSAGAVIGAWIWGGGYLG